MFHLSFCRYFEYLHFLYWIFFHKINIFHFVSEKRAFCNYLIFFRIFSSQVSNLEHMLFFSGLSRFLRKEMLVYNFFPIKFYFYWTILATWVYEGEVCYITHMKIRKQLNFERIAGEYELMVSVWLPVLPDGRLILSPSTSSWLSSQEP